MNPLLTYAKRLLSFAFVCGALLACAGISRAQSPNVALHYKDVVGTYETRDGDTITVDRAPQGMMRVHLEATYPYRTVNGEMMANSGTAEGTVKLVGDTALFKPADTQNCTIKLVFKPQRLIVTQSGTDAECGFGNNVNASGNYKLKTRRVEHFGEAGAPLKPKRRS